MAAHNVPDMGEFFDFGEAAMPDESQVANGQVEETQIGESHEASENAQAGEEFNTDFSSWLPRYQKPPHPCEYCQLKGLECFIYDAMGSASVRCSPCNALFRPCSFVDLDQLPAQRKRTALDTLAIVGEDEERCFGGTTGRKQMRTMGHVGPIEDDKQVDESSKKGLTATRFPRAAIKVLKDWYLHHIEHPYPTEDEKESLAQQTGLSLGQISGWMANTRRRQKSRPKRSASPSIRPSTEVINIPPGRTWASLNPLERWEHSPPENEPAPLTAIAHAMEEFDPPESAGLSSGHRQSASNASSGSFSVFRAPSISSLETGLTNMSSGSLGSLNSAYSHGSRRSLGSFNSLKTKEKRRRRRMTSRVLKPDSSESPRLFQCTFCTDRFKTKYDWARHEKSLHLSLEKWICAPLGEVLTDKATGKTKCVYCDLLDPSDEHLATHNHTSCCEKGLEIRTFYRKDHLRQHLRLMHGCKMTPSMDTWRAEAQFVNSRCGFCAKKFTKWQDRVDHLSKEFRNGAEMKDWKGCRGLDPHVAIHVTNAMPPYLIGMESKSPFPFSASNTSSLKQSFHQLNNDDMEHILQDGNTFCDLTGQLAESKTGVRPSTTDGSVVLSKPVMPSTHDAKQANPNATCWEILTLRLGRFARQHIEANGPHAVTDDMLQQEARMILYGEADGWEQTAADNPEWLNLFKRAHGIDNQASLQGDHTHHEVMEDLGIRSYSQVDPSFDLSNFNNLTMTSNNPQGPLAKLCVLAGTTNLSNQIQHLSSGQVTPYSNPGLTGSLSAASMSPAHNLTTSSMDTMRVYTTIPERQCTAMGEPIFGQNGDVSFAGPSSRGGLSKTSSWSSDQPFPTASYIAQCSAAGEPVYQCAKVGLRSFSPLDSQACPVDNDAFMSSIQEKACTKSGDAIPVTAVPDFHLPSWDQLPKEFQDPAISAGYVPTIPISTSDAGIAGLSAGAMDAMRWDDAELNFAMDMDVDLDLEMNVLGKC